MKMDHAGMHAPKHAPYRQLAIMVALSFVAMYVLMYAMVDAFSNVISNYNQFFMAGLMTAPMVILEVLLMGMMYPNKRQNAIIVAVGVLALVGFWFLIRGQVGIGDKQFLRSMIPHHAGALLMCEQANIEDPDIKQLCKSIEAGQQAEIDLMKAKLKDLERR